jgi:pyruvate-formate lyase-activating enzyme
LSRLDLHLKLLKYNEFQSDTCESTSRNFFFLNVRKLIINNLQFISSLGDCLRFALKCWLHGFVKTFFHKENTHHNTASISRMTSLNKNTETRNPAINNFYLNSTPANARARRLHVRIFSHIYLR